jgi:hypothetical protein
MSNCDVLLPLLMMVLALACVVVLGRVLSVCCCRGRGGSSVNTALTSTPPFSVVHSVYFQAIGVKVFFSSRRRGKG